MSMLMKHSVKIYVYIVDILAHSKTSQKMSQVV
jgi:hypothetical protein